MIYKCTNSVQMFDSDKYEVISPERCLEIMSSWKCYQFDSETDGKNPHIKNVICIQFGYDQTDEQIVVDCTTVDIRIFKKFIESRYMIGQNLKFDIQFLFKHGIYPRKVYDTMIVEQMLYLGYPTGKLKPWQVDAYYSLGFPGKLSFSLQAIVERRLGIYLSKEIRGQIRYRGLDDEVLMYAAGDVMHLQKVMASQRKDLIERNCVYGAKIECDAVPAMAYMEWCGIKLDENRWKEKMRKDKEKLLERKKDLDLFVSSNNKYSKFAKVDLQGDLWEGFDTKPKCIINWDSSKQVIPFLKFLGFNVTVQDKETGEDKETALEKELRNQVGVNDEFLKLYFDFKEASKVVGTYGQGHLDLINPITGRLHTSFKQLGAATGRMSSGGGSDEDLSALKKMSKKIKLVNLQQLPHDAETRSCFVAEKGNVFCSCDFSAEESRLGADIYNDDEMRKEFTERTGDTHAMFAWAVFKEQCEALGCTSALEVKKKAKKWRDKVKSVEFAYLFGAAAPTIAKSAGCSVEQAQKYIDDLDKFFVGRTDFCKKGSKFVRNNGYVVISPITGHRVLWWDWKLWKERQKTFTPEFWEDYRMNHKGTGDEVAKTVTTHFQAASKYDRYALNSPTQGSGAIILKKAMKNLYDYIIDNNLFDVVKLCVVVHDEMNIEYPKEMEGMSEVLKKCMEDAAAMFCKSLPIPACPEIGDCWIH